MNRAVFQVRYPSLTLNNAVFPFYIFIGVTDILHIYLYAVCSLTLQIQVKHHRSEGNRPVMLHSACVYGQLL